jgi:DNA-binding GntR family transcriptional regulator
MVKPEKTSRKAAAATPPGEGSLLSQQAYQAIKEKILMTEIPPLGTIDEQRLMGELELGRTPIREALQRLAQEGFVTIIPYRGSVASGIDMSELHQIMEMRVPLEIIAGRLAAQRVSDADIAALRALVGGYDIERLCREQNFVELLRLDQRFHHAVTRLADNRYIQRTLDNLRDLTWRHYILFYRRNPPRPTDSFSNYAAVIDALAKRSPDLVEARLEEHFKDSMTIFPSRL